MMDNNKGNYYNQTMDDIVFDNRNKNYGAFMLRLNYTRHLLIALTVSITLFTLGIFSPKIVNSLGLTKEEEVEVIDTTIVTLAEPPSIKPDEPPPPPPPPPLEVTPPTQRFMEMVAVKKEEAIDEPPPTIEELDDKVISNTTQEGTGDVDAPPVIVDVGGGDVVDPNKVYTDVDQKASFKGGEDALYSFLQDNTVYPDEEKQNEIEGQATITFVVTTTGNVEKVKVERSSGSSKLDAEAVRVIKMLNKQFNPGKINGKPVNSYCRIPISFNLEDE